ncbi:hypothetical protein Landi51_12390 [Colletotrichum acutatum]
MDENLANAFRVSGKLQLPQREARISKEGTLFPCGSGPSKMDVASRANDSRQAVLALPVIYDGNHLTYLLPASSSHRHTHAFLVLQFSQREVTQTGPAEGKAPSYSLRLPVVTVQPKHMSEDCPPFLKPFIFLTVATSSQFSFSSTLEQRPRPFFKKRLKL